MNFFKRTMKKENSLEDFEFVDFEGDLDIDLSKSPAPSGSEKFSSGLGLVISALSAIADDEGITIQIPVKTMAATTAVGAITGSLIGGPSGLAIGLLTGAVMAYRHSPNRSKSPKSESRKASVRQIFSQMTMNQKKELIQELIRCVKQSSVRGLITEIVKNERIRNVAIDILSGFFMRKMGISLIKPI